MIAMGAEGELAREIGAPGLAGAKGGERRCARVLGWGWGTMVLRWVRCWFRRRLT